MNTPITKDDYLAALRKVKERLARKEMFFRHEVGSLIGENQRRLTTSLLLVAVRPITTEQRQRRHQVENEVNILDFLARTLHDWPVDDSLSDKPQEVTDK